MFWVEPSPTAEALGPVSRESGSGANTVSCSFRPHQSLPHTGRLIRSTMYMASGGHNTSVLRSTRRRRTTTSTGLGAHCSAPQRIDLASFRARERGPTIESVPIPEPCRPECRFVMCPFGRPHVARSMMHQRLTAQSIAHERPRALRQKGQQSKICPTNPTDRICGVCPLSMPQNGG